MGPSCRNSHHHTFCSICSVTGVKAFHGQNDKINVIHILSSHDDQKSVLLMWAGACYWLFVVPVSRRVLADPYWPGWCLLPTLPSHCTRPKVREKLSSEVVLSTVQANDVHSTNVLLKKISDDWGLMVGLKGSYMPEHTLDSASTISCDLFFSHAVYTRLTRQVGSPATSTHLSCQIFGGGNSGPADSGNADVSTQNR